VCEVALSISVHDFVDVNVGMNMLVFIEQFSNQGIKHASMYDSFMYTKDSQIVPSAYYAYVALDQTNSRPPYFTHWCTPHQFQNARYIVHTPFVHATLSILTMKIMLSGKSTIA
jgi:hypothetical protein